MAVIPINIGAGLRLERRAESPVTPPADIRTLRRPQARTGAEPVALLADDLARETYCVLGIPLDAVTMPTVIRQIETAAAAGRRLWLSTANLNFLINSLKAEDFARSLRHSDLCTADGGPIVRICRLLGVPVKERVAGADILERLRLRERTGRRLGVYFLGGADGVGAAASAALNAQETQLVCVGSANPGYGSVGDLSRDAVIEEVNASGADVLVVALGAPKGQAWLARNRQALTVPVRAHLGAAINFQAGTVRRAPLTVQRLGLEWLWRIKEEPALWRRYWSDGWALLRLLATRVLPLALLLRHTTRQAARAPWPLQTRMMVGDGGAVRLRLTGDATAAHIGAAIKGCRAALVAAQVGLVVDLSAVRHADTRFLGLLLMLRKRADEAGVPVRITGVSRRLALLFRLSEASFLLEPAGADPC